MNRDNSIPYYSVSVEDAIVKPGDKIRLLEMCTTLNGSRCSMLDLSTLNTSTCLINLCSLCKTRRLSEGINLANISHMRRKEAHSSESLKLIDTTLFPIFKSIIATTFHHFFYFNLLMIALYFPLQLFHINFQHEKQPGNIDDGFFVTDDLIENFITQEIPTRPVVISPVQGFQLLGPN